MKSATSAVAIDGGITGCSALHHLTLEGWEDVVLIERGDLTSGTTWHSAKKVTNFGAIQVMVGLKSHSIRLFREFADYVEHPINYNSGDGDIQLASEEWHLDGYRHFQSITRGMDLDTTRIRSPK